jgi:hypothetical protein
LLLFSGIASAGVGFGVFLYAPMVRLLIDTYGWRGAMLLLAAVFSHGWVFASLMRPPEKKTTCQQLPPTQEESESAPYKHLGFGSAMGSMVLISSTSTLNNMAN